jgi:hypothetical protein
MNEPMKILVNRILLMILSLILCEFTNGFAQETSLDRFTASEINNRVYLEWIISAGNTCQGIHILRSTDSINFIQIGNIDGVCGNITTPQGYNFTDDNPVKNKINYYRLELGGIGLSKIVSVEIIDLQSGGYQVRPHPITSKAIIYFSNPGQRVCQLNIYSISGNEVLHQDVYDSSFYISKGELQTGFYFFTITTREGTRIMNGNFLIID